MHLEFNSLDELREIILAMGYVRKIDLEIEAAQQAEWRAAMSEWYAARDGQAHDGEQFDTEQTPIQRTLAEHGAVKPLTHDGEQFDTEQTPIRAEHVSVGDDGKFTVATVAQGEQGNEPAPTEQPEPTKRKRRTKAEMEAVRTAEMQPAATSATTTAESAESATLPATQTENPFEASTSNPSTATQAILNAPSGQAATLAGIQAMQSSPFDSAATAVTTAQPTTVNAVAGAASTDSNGSGAVDAATYVETRALEILSTQTEPLTAVKHMHRCRDFIAKHGQARYLEAFALAGLSATIGTYKPEQCARHQAALEFLALV